MATSYEKEKGSSYQTCVYSIKRSS